MSWWAENFVFMPALGFIANVNHDLYPPDFVAERNAFGYLLGKEDVEPLFSRYVQQVVAHATWLTDILADGRPFLLGPEPSAADLAAYPSIWFLCKWGGDETERRLPVRPLFPRGRARRGPRLWRPHRDDRRGGGRDRPRRDSGGPGPAGQRRPERPQGRDHGDGHPTMSAAIRSRAYSSAPTRARCSDTPNSEHCLIITPLISREPANHAFFSKGRVIAGLQLPRLTPHPSLHLSSPR